MKLIKKIAAVSAAFLLFLSLCPQASAAGRDKRVYEGLSWEQVVRREMEQYKVEEQSIRAGYLNLVTGEEHYINADEYMVAGSMYKLPLCMYFTEHIASGDIDWSPYEEHFTFEEIRRKVLVDSSNDWAIFLWDMLGGYTKFRELTAPYMGVEPGEEKTGLTDQNMYTPRQFISCLKLLYDEQERFPGIIETMQKAEPDRFFKLNEPRFKIAHKYGYYSANGRSNMDDCAICFATQPIAIVLFTQNLPDPENFLSAYATAMCEYTDYQASRPEATPEADPEMRSAPVAAVAPAAPRQETPGILPYAFAGLFAALGLAAALLCRKAGARFLPLGLAVLVAAAGMGLSAFGLRAGAVYARSSGDPAQAVSAFFDALCTGDYDAAYGCLRDYSDLGLAEEPSSVAGQRIYRALHESFSYELTGPCERELLEASQQLRFRYLSLPALEADVAAETRSQIERIVGSRSVSEVYDENRQFLPAVTEEAYLAALDAVLAHAEDYYTDVQLRLSLSYTDGRWQLLTSPELLRAINGGTGY